MEIVASWVICIFRSRDVRRGDRSRVRGAPARGGIRGGRRARRRGRPRREQDRARSRRGESYIEDVTSDRLRAALPEHRGLEPLRATGPGRRRADLRPDTADAEPGARPAATASPPAPHLGTWSRGDSWSCSSRPPIRAPRARSWSHCSSTAGLRVGDGLNVAFSPERVDPGRTDYTLRTTPKLVGGLTSECTERAAELYSLVCDVVVPVSSPEVGRDGQAAREHLPLGQHRAGQRAGDPRRADEGRHLGGDRRRRDQAIRLHALRARARNGRPLPARRSVLPDLARAQVPHVDRVHRARRQDQPADALPLRASGSSGR